MAEDRERFQALVDELGPASSRPTAPPLDLQQAVHAARRIGYPGAGPAQLRARRPGDGDRLRRGRADAATSSQAMEVSPGKPILIDKFLEAAIEVDVDCLCDGTRTHHRRRDAAHRGGRHPLRRLGLRHPAAQPAGRRHRGDQTADARAGPRAERQRPDERAVRGHLRRDHRHPDDLRPGGQPARQPHGAVRLQGDRRAAGPARRAGHGRQDARRAGPASRRSMPTHFSVKESVFPFNKFPGVDIILGPGDALDRRGDGHRRHASRWRSPRARSRPTAPLPPTGTVFVSRGRPRQAGGRADRPRAGRAWATGCCRRAARPSVLRASGITVEEIPKLQEGRPNLIDHMKNDEMALVINTPLGPKGAGPTRARSAPRRCARRDLHHDAGGGPGRRRGVPGA